MFHNTELIFLKNIVLYFILFELMDTGFGSREKLHRRPMRKLFENDLRNGKNMGLDMEGVSKEVIPHFAQKVVLEAT